MRHFVSLLFAVIACWAIAQVQTPTDTPTPPSYTPPVYQDVLAGKAPLRVLLVSKQAMLAWKGDAEVRVVSTTDTTVLYAAPAGEMVGAVSVPETKGFSLRKNGENFCPVAGSFRVESDKPIQVWTKVPNTWTSYPSPIIVTATADGTFSIAREMPLEEYLRNVVPAEMPASFHPQALRAQAIIARTYTLTELGRHADEGADICGTVHCQAYVPDAKRAKSTDDAVATTKGIVLLYGDGLAQTYYHSNCGGAIDDATYVWGLDYDLPYLKGGVDFPGKAPDGDICVTDVLAHKDTYCKNASNAHWTKTFTADEVNALVSKNLAKVTGDATVTISTVTNMAVETRSPFGRAASLRVEGDGASVLVYGDKIRWLFGSGGPGADGLWSTLFDLTVTRDTDGNIIKYTFTGAGRGHGLGLCQWGADGRGKAGQSYREILQAYYPGTRLSDGK